MPKSPKKKPDIKKLKEIKPRDMSFELKIKEDRSFLLEVINDPVSTFRKHGYVADEKLVHMLNGISKNVLDRASQLYVEIGGLASATNGCRACKACQACEACANISIH